MQDELTSQKNKSNPLLRIEIKALSFITGRGQQETNVSIPFNDSKFWLYSKLKQYVYNNREYYSLNH